MPDTLRLPCNKTVSKQGVDAKGSSVQVNCRGVVLGDKRFVPLAGECVNIYYLLKMAKGQTASADCTVHHKTFLLIQVQLGGELISEFEGQKLDDFYL